MYFINHDNLNTLSISFKNYHRSNQHNEREKEPLHGTYSYVIGMEYTPGVSNNFSIEILCSNDKVIKEKYALQHRVFIWNFSHITGVSH